MATVAIIGGGVGGIVTANELRKLLPENHRIVLIEKSSYHVFAPSFPWVMVGEREPDDIRRPVKDLLRKGVELLQDEVVEVNPTAKKVQTKSTAIGYDFLVVAPGAELALEKVPGAEGAEIHTYYTLDGASRLRPVLEGFTGGRIAVVIADSPYKCPAAPHEGSLLLTSFFRRKGLADKVEVHLFTPESQPMPTAGPQMGQIVRQLLEGMGVKFHPNYKLAEIEPGKKVLKFENGEEFNYDLLIVIPPAKAPGFVVESGLTDGLGWIKANPYTLETQFDRLYAIGDVAYIELPGRWDPNVPLTLPKAGVFAHGQGEVVAREIAGQILGKPAEEKFDGMGYCVLETGAKMTGFAYGSFYAQPAPQMMLKQAGWSGHMGKVLFEKWWLTPPGLRRQLLGALIKAGSKLYGIPLKLD